MAETEKEYLIYRVLVIGPEKTGKKTFIKKMISLPTNSQILGVPYEQELMKKYIMKNKEKKPIRITKGNKEKKDSKSPPKSTSKTGNISDKENTKITNTKSSAFSYENLNQKKREKFEEFPAKLYTINKNKILYKMYYIAPADQLNYYYEPKEEDDSEFELEKEHKISLKGIKNDITNILTNKTNIIDEDKLVNFNVKMITLIIFMYDLSDFSSFKEIIMYYSILSKFLKFNENESVQCVLIGNKKDKENVKNKQQNNIYNNFISKTGILSFEVSDKPFYNFSSFFNDFFYKVFYMNFDNNKELNKQDTDAFLNKLIKIKPNFSMSQRSNIITDTDNPGPIYNTNIYTCNSPKELYNALTNKKTRFVAKIFLNKTGPKIVRPKSSKEALVKQQMEKEKENEQFLFNKLTSNLIENNYNNRTVGCSFGIVEGKLGLKEERKKLILAQGRKFIESLGNDNIADFVKNLDREAKDQNYFTEANNRKNEIYEDRIRLKKEKNKEILNNHKRNLNELKKSREKMKESIYKSQKIDKYYNTYSNSLDMKKYNKDEIMEMQKTENKKRYYDLLYGKNKNHIKILDVKKEEKEEKKKLSKFPEGPGPNTYDTRGNLLNPNKGARILGKRKDPELSRVDPDYVYFKDDFEKIAEKTCNKRKQFKSRFSPPKSLPPPKPYRDASVWKRWTQNKENSERSENMRLFAASRKELASNNIEKKAEIRKQEEDLLKLRRELLNRKGFQMDEEEQKIRYGLVEFNYPSYTIQGRHNALNPMTQTNTMANTNFTDSLDPSPTPIFPLPNFSYIRPGPPRVVFGKAKRFPDIFSNRNNNYNKNSNTMYNNSNNMIFADGVFDLPEKSSFSNKEPFSLGNKRMDISGKSKGPGPNRYKIKSQFDCIVESGAKKSENFKKLLESRKIEEEETLKRIKKVRENYEKRISMNYLEELKNKRKEENNVEEKEI